MHQRRTNQIHKCSLLTPDVTNLFWCSITAPLFAMTKLRWFQIQNARPIDGVAIGSQLILCNATMPPLVDQVFGHIVPVIGGLAMVEWLLSPCLARWTRSSISRPTRCTSSFPACRTSSYGRIRWTNKVCRFVCSSVGRICGYWSDMGNQGIGLRSCDMLDEYWTNHSWDTHDRWLSALIGYR